MSLVCDMHASPESLVYLGDFSGLAWGTTLRNRRCRRSDRDLTRILDADSPAQIQILLAAASLRATTSLYPAQSLKALHPSCALSDAPSPCSSDDRQRYLRQHGPVSAPHGRGKHTAYMRVRPPCASHIRTSR